MRSWNLAPVVLITLLFAATGALAQNATGNGNAGQRLRGTVIKVSPKGQSFDMVDQAGAIVAVPLQSSTVYQANQADARFNDVVKPGMDVRVMPAADGSAETVVARGMVSQIDTVQFKAFLGASDAEWAVLQPRIEKVRLLLRQSEGRGLGGGNNNGNGGNGNGGGNNAPLVRNPVRELRQTLQSAYFEQSLSPEQLQAKLTALRDARAKSREELAAARKALTEVITVRQEVLLVASGILE